MGTPGARRGRWQEAILELRRRHPHWGPKKLRVLLQRQQRGAQLPSERTIARLLLAGGFVGRRKQRSRSGPRVEALERTEAARCNTVWTVDFKGHFRTGDGALCRPLTVRDLFSRYVLMSEHVPQPSEAVVRQAMIPCFQRYGLPRVIRVDNGSPFAGVGALNLSALSVWWLRLGIRVEFTRRGKPQDNGAHEQMHRILKQATARPPAANLQEQERRMREFCQEYNEIRPHEGLGQRTPSEVYRKSPRGYRELERLRYPANWITRRASRNGVIKWAGRPRLVGRAFIHEYLGLKPKKALGADEINDVVHVYLGPQLIGEIHRHDLAGMRPARWQYPRKEPSE